MPTLLLVNTVINSGSTGRIVEQLGQYMLSKGWNSIVAYGKVRNGTQLSSIKIGNKADILYHRVQSLLYDKHGLASVRATESLIRNICRIKPDIIHLHNLHGYYLNYTLLFAFLAKETIPVVWTFHDCWPITGHCSYFSDINCLKWQIKCHHCPKIRKYPASILLDRSERNFEIKRKLFGTLSNLHIIAVSNWLASILHSSFLGKSHILMINNGIDLDAFQIHPVCSAIRQKYGIPTKFMLLGVASTWDERKGLNDFISLRKILSDEYIIVLVGLSSKQLKVLPKGIVGIKRIENFTELAQLYSTADIVMNLSRQETFGLTTVEGLACGTPGIVYNSTASPELLTPETGIIVEVGDLNQTVESIEKIRERGKEYYSHHCRLRAEKHYNKEDRFREYYELYCNILDKKLG